MQASLQACLDQNGHSPRLQQHSRMLATDSKATSGSNAQISTSLMEVITFKKMPVCVPVFKNVLWHFDFRFIYNALIITKVDATIIKSIAVKTEKS